MRNCRTLPVRRSFSMRKKAEDAEAVADPDDHDFFAQIRLDNVVRSARARLLPPWIQTSTGRFPASAGVRMSSVRCPFAADQEVAAVPALVVLDAGRWLLRRVERAFPWPNGRGWFPAKVGHRWRGEGMPRKMCPPPHSIPRTVPPSTLTGCAIAAVEASSAITASINLMRPRTPCDR